MAPLELKVPLEYMGKLSALMASLAVRWQFGTDNQGGTGRVPCFREIDKW